MTEQDYSVQVERIRNKLQLAVIYNQNYASSGYTKRLYDLLPPATSEEVAQLEQQHRIKLPTCYRAFLTEITRGSTSGNAMAGPYDGMPSPINVFTVPYAQMQPTITPNMTDEEWKILVADYIAYDHEIYDACYPDINRLPTEEEESLLEAETQFILRGTIMLSNPLASNKTYHMIMTGEHAGRIFVSSEGLVRGHTPFFLENTTFLDWYEQWLDYHFFDAKKLERDYVDQINDKQKRQAINFYDFSPRHLVVTDPSSVKWLHQEYQNTSGELHEKFFHFLIRYDYEAMKPQLLELSQQKENKRAFIKLINLGTPVQYRADWHAYFKDELQKAADQNDEDLFSAYCHALIDSELPYEDEILQYMNHPIYEFRKATLTCFIYAKTQTRTSTEYEYFCPTSTNDFVQT